MSEHATYYMSDVPGIERCMHVERTTPPEWVRVYMRKRAQRRTKRNRNSDLQKKLMLKLKIAELESGIREFNETR